MGRFSFLDGKVLIDTQKLNKDFFSFLPLCLFLILCTKFDLIYNKKSMLHQNITPFGVHYKKICNHLCETATNSAKIHSLARKYKHLCINQIQLRFLHFYQHSITLLVIQMCHSAYKRDRKIYFHSGGGRGGGTPIHYLYGYVPPNGVVILKLLI